MLNSQRFSFVEGRDAFGDIDFVPQLTLMLGYRNSTVEVSALKNNPICEAVVVKRSLSSSCYFLILYKEI
jgi:hypothetical protein